MVKQIEREIGGKGSRFTLCFQEFSCFSVSPVFHQCENIVIFRKSDNKTIDISNSPIFHFLLFSTIPSGFYMISKCRKKLS